MKRTPTRNRRVRIQLNDNDGYPQKTYRPHAACRRAAAFRFGFPEPLREHDDPPGLPPVIVNMTPDNFSTNRPLVNHEKIYIEFDEFVQLKDQQKEFFTSPQMKKKP